MLTVGDKVIMNETYKVPEQNKGVIFTVRSEHFLIGDMECVLLEGRTGGYAVNGLTKVKEDE